MEIVYQPYIDPEFQSLLERIHPPRVCIDNDASQDCTLVKCFWIKEWVQKQKLERFKIPSIDRDVKLRERRITDLISVVDSANRHGILLEMVQVLTDLDLVISKSYISSDGGWLMDVFHVTDQLGNKVTDETLILYIQQALSDTRRRGGGIPKELQTCLKREVKPCHVSTEYTALEMTGRDRLGLMSEISAALYELRCHVTAAVSWTHDARAACIIHIEDGIMGGPIIVPKRLAQVQEMLESVVEAHHESGEHRSVRLTAPAVGRTHTERRLHQLMYANRDYEQCQGCDGSCRQWNGCTKTHVTIEACREKGYSVVNLRCRDRNKLLFDTVCALTDMQYVVFHAAISSKGTMADQEYFIRRQDGCSLITQSEREALAQCLIAATERRVSHGLRLDLCTENKMGLLSDVTRVFRENGLSITRAEIGTYGEKATGSFYVTDASGHEANLRTVELVRQEIGGSTLMVYKSPNGTSRASSSSISRTSSGEVEERAKFSLGNLWSQLERFSENFGFIKP